MGWKQSCAPIQLDNSTAAGHLNNTIIAWHIKSLEMRRNWLKCRESQEQFCIYWDKGSHNLVDYHTKHHPPEYHIAHRHAHGGWFTSANFPTIMHSRVFLIPLFFSSFLLLFLVFQPTWLQGYDAYECSGLRPRSVWPSSHWLASVHQSTHPRHREQHTHNIVAIYLQSLLFFFRLWPTKMKKIRQKVQIHSQVLMTETIPEQGEDPPSKRDTEQDRTYLLQWVCGYLKSIHT